ncbi:MAG TPA: DUF177 domain-containing protein [Gaiellaceae bacterium]|nr:DUF177 domain-containing protein [Gaiellaceae bacterium]
MTSLDLRRLRIRPGEQHRERRAVELEPYDLGGQRYEPHPRDPEAELTLTRTMDGLVLELDLDARLAGPCFRCLTDTEVELRVRGREYQAGRGPADDEELRTPYVEDERLDVSRWARDAIALALPEKILCREDCAGLCAVCGRDLNAEPHTHEETAADPRWGALAELRDRL